VLIAILGLGILGVGGYQALHIVMRNSPAAPAIKQTSLVDYIDNPNVSVRLTIKGPVVATEKHIEQTFTISSSTREIDAAKGYASTPDYTQSYSNNQSAFADFMHALQDAGFTKTAKSTVSTDVGNCPSGTRYIYELIDSGKNALQSWSSSCGDGTFDGDANSIRALFQAQTPDYNKLPSELRV
jgi:hypothetical protein